MLKEEFGDNSLIQSKTFLCYKLSTDLISENIKNVLETMKIVGKLSMMFAELSDCHTVLYF